MTEFEISRMRKLRMEGLKCVQIAERMGVDVSTVSRHTSDMSQKKPRVPIKTAISLVHMDGTKAYVTNLRGFARRNDLTYTLLWLVVNGQRKMHKGWALDIEESVHAS